MKGFTLIGDTHGNFEYIRKNIKTRLIRDTTLLHVGDFGVGFTTERNDKIQLERLNARLKKNNCQMYVIRGNHDNPKYFDGTWDMEYLHLVPDYTVITIDGFDILMVGGAISIDRGPRKRNQLAYARQNVDKELYWFDEEFVLDEEKLKEIKGVTYVVTHTTPHFATPVNNVGIPTHGYLVETFADDDIHLKEDLNKERADMTKMYEILKENNYILKWFYGHFHSRTAMYYEDTDFVMLGVGEFREVFTYNKENN